MAYPGDSNLDPAVQQRILTAFKEAVRLHREGHGEEARTILRSITDVDARFTPAQRLEQAIAAGSPVDLAQLIGEVSAQGEMNVEVTMAKARQAVAQRDFQGALTLAQSVLRDMPGHAEARALALEVQARLRAGGEIQTHIDRIRQALDAGLPEEARGFLKLAKNLDPDHPEIVLLERRMALAARPLETEGEPEPEFEFEVFDQPGEVQVAAPPAKQAPPPASRTRAPGPGSVDAPFAPLPPSQPPAVRPAAAAPPPKPAPAPPAAPAAAPQPAAGGFAFDAPAGGGLDFQASSGAAPAATPESSGAKVQALLDQGQQEFDRGDFQSAVDTWSRIYLIDVSNAEADRRIEQARRRREEVERLAEQHFYEAREAFEQKRLDDARLLCQQVLKLVPQHLEAHDLLQRLETPAAPPPPPAPSLAQEEDLFKDEFVPAAITSSGSVPAVKAAAAAAGSAPSERVFERVGTGSAAGARRRLLPELPYGWIAAAAGALVLVVVGVLLLRGKVFSGGGATVADAIAESEQLAKQGRLQEATQLLQSLQGQVEGELANRVNQRVLEYQKRLKAKAAPPPASEAKVAADAVAAGNRVKAMRLIRDGLAKVPGDPGLVKLESEVNAYDAAIPALAAAVAGRNWDSMRSLAEQVLKSHPADAEVLGLWRVATFNLAVLDLRKYQVAEGHGLLVELAKRDDDADVERLRALAKSYLSRPADPRYQIFVSNVQLRSAE